MASTSGMTHKTSTFKLLQESINQKLVNHIYPSKSKLKQSPKQAHSGQQHSRHLF
jgi:hypothetical protein